MNKKKYFLGFVVTLFVLLPHLLLAADQDSSGVHWAYSSFFGTGWYSLDDNRSVFVMRIPGRYALRTSGMSEVGTRKLGVDIHYPVTIGVHDIDYLPGIVSSENFGTVSFTPGLELEIPITKNFYLRPFVDLGWGKELETGDSAWIYQTGIKSRYTFFTGKSLEWSLLGNLYYAGHTPNDERSASLGGGLLGFEMTHALKKTFFDRSIDLHWHAIYSFLDNELDFPNADGSSTEINDIIEFGVALSLRKQRFNLLLWKPQRLGLGFKFSPDGDIRGLTLNFRSWFTR